MHAYFLYFSNLRERDEDGIQQVCMDRKQDFRRRHGMPLQNEGKNQEAHYRNGCRGRKIVHKQLELLELLERFKRFKRLKRLEREFNCIGFSL